jgi:hypothetical protein
VIAKAAKSGLWPRHQVAGAIALRQLQWKHAKRPDASGVAMTIHMSKHRLGEHDKFLHLNLTVEQVDEMIAKLEHALAQQQQMGVPREVKSIQGTPPNQETP